MQRLYAAPRTLFVLREISGVVLPIIPIRKAAKHSFRADVRISLIQTDRRPSPPEEIPEQREGPNLADGLCHWAGEGNVSSCRELVGVLWIR